MVVPAGEAAGREGDILNREIGRAAGVELDRPVVSLIVVRRRAIHRVRFNEDVLVNIRGDGAPRENDVEKKTRSGSRQGSQRGKTSDYDTEKENPGSC